MSDPVTNAEVEDVLSSIRRLVTDENPETDAPQEEDAGDTHEDRLVLTEALRVESPSDDHAVASSSPSEGAEQDAATEFSNEDADEDPVQLSVYELTPEVAVTSAAEAPAEFLEETAAAPVTDLTSESLSTKIAALEAVISRRRDEWEPDDVGEDAYAGTRGETMAWEGEQAEATTEDLAEGAREGISNEEDATVPEDPEPEFVEEPGVDTGPSPQFIHRNHAPEIPETLDGEDDVLDEEALRDLVAEIVRQELQGALGERITRNVRKLVRREINRALAAQNLD